MHRILYLGKVLSYLVLGASDFDGVKQGLIRSTVTGIS